MFTPNWDKYLSHNEKQRRKYEDRQLDTLSCITQANINMWQMIFNRNLKYIKGKEREFLENFIIDGKVEFSKRFIAKLSETSREGNSYDKVNRTIMKYGLIPEKDYPWDEADTWEEYYKEIPQHLINKGKEFFRFFNLSYGWTFELNKYIKKSPLAITVFAWLQNTRKYNNLYYKPNNVGRNHGVVLISTSNPYTIRDSYIPWLKNLHKSNYPSWGIFGKLILKNMKFIKENDQKTIFNSDTGETGFIVRGYLALAKTNTEKINMLLDMKNRGVINLPAVHIKNDLWEALPKKRFSEI